LKCLHLLQVERVIEIQVSSPVPGTKRIAISQLYFHPGYRFVLRKLPIVNPLLDPTITAAVAKFWYKTLTRESYNRCTVGLRICSCFWGL
jgi:hypothetical protein